MWFPGFFSTLLCHSHTKWTGLHRPPSHKDKSHSDLLCPALPLYFSYPQVSGRLTSVEAHALNIHPLLMRGEWYSGRNFLDPKYLFTLLIVDNVTFSGQLKKSRTWLVQNPAEGIFEGQIPPKKESRWQLLWEPNLPSCEESWRLPL